MGKGKEGGIVKEESASWEGDLEWAVEGLEERDLDMAFFLFEVWVKRFLVLYVEYVSV